MTESDPLKELGRVELKLVPPRAEKGWMIGFTCENDEGCRAYNNAIEIVAKGVGLHPFHQVGGNISLPGYQAWEFSRSNEAELQELLAKIKETAEGWLRSGESGPPRINRFES